MTGFQIAAVVLIAFSICAMGVAVWMLSHNHMKDDR